MFSFSKLSFIHLTNTAGARYELMLCISHLKAYLNGSTSPASDVPSRFRLQPCIKLPNHHGQYQRVLQVLLFITFFFLKKQQRWKLRADIIDKKRGQNMRQKKEMNKQRTFSVLALWERSSPLQCSKSSLNDRGRRKMIIINASQMIVKISDRNITNPQQSRVRQYVNVMNERVCYISLFSKEQRRDSFFT